MIFIHWIGHLYLLLCDFLMLNHYNKLMSKEVMDKGIVSNLNIDNIKPKNISAVCTLVILIFSIALSLLVIILNVYIHTPLFIQGLNFIYEYQSSQPSPFIRVVQNIFSLLCNPIGIGVIAGIYYLVVKRKLMLLIHLSYFLFTTYIIAILKQAFQQSRPIWYDSRIQNWQWFCPKDFGNPSGHSFAVLILYQPLVSDAIGYWKYRPWIIVLILLCIMVPISRMYLGVHSANQILFGLTLGSISLILYKFVYQKALYQLTWQFLTGTKRKIKIIFVMLLNAFVIAIPIIFYYVNLNQRPMLLKDINNLNQQCNTHLTGEQVQGHMLTACSIGCILFGLVHGFLLLKNTPQYRRYLLGYWVYETKCKFFLKILVYIIAAGLPFLTFFLIGQFAFKGSVIGQYVFLCAAINAGCIGLSFLTPLLAQKWKIMKYDIQERGESD